MRPEDGPSIFKEILENLPSLWGERDMRAVASDAVVVREGGVLLGYLLGAMTTHELAYVQLIATRTDQRGRDLGRLLYDTFLSDVRRRGARRVDASTATTNNGSVAFHQRLGFSAEVVPDYAGPGTTPCSPKPAPDASGH